MPDMGKFREAKVSWMECHSEVDSPQLAPDGLSSDTTAQPRLGGVCCPDDVSAADKNYYFFLLKFLYEAALNVEAETWRVISAWKDPPQPSTGPLCGASSSKMQHPHTHTMFSLSNATQHTPVGAHARTQAHTFSFIHSCCSCPSLMLTTNTCFTLFTLFTLYPQHNTLSVCLGHLCHPTGANRKRNTA